MNYNSRLKLTQMKNNAIPNEKNVPYDSFIEELEKLNTEIWDKEDFILANSVLGGTKEPELL